MKLRSLLQTVVSAALVLPAFAAPARATVELAFLNLPGQPGATGGIELACSQPDSAYRLFVTFSTDEPMSDFVGLTADLWFAYVPSPSPRPPLSPFWHFETGGCNAGAVQVSVVPPTGIAGAASPWEPLAWSVTTSTLYAPHPTQPGAGIMLVEAVRLGPRALDAGETYYGFMLELQTCSADACEGCDELMGVEISNLTLLRYGGGGVSLGASDRAVCFNFDGVCPVIGARAPKPEAGATLRASALPIPRLDGPCGPTPTLERSWGALKIRYR